MLALKNWTLPSLWWTSINFLLLVSAPYKCIIGWLSPLSNDCEKYLKNHQMIPYYV